MRLQEHHTRQTFKLVRQHAACHVEDPVQPSPCWPFLTHAKVHNPPIQICNNHTRPNLALQFPFVQEITTDHKCANNDHIALTNRHLMTSEWRAPMDQPMIEHAYNLVRAKFPPHALQPLSREQVVARKTGTKRQIYARALQTLQHKPICSKDARLKTFVKNERKLATKAPRAIQARTARYTLELQRYILPFDTQLKKISSKGLTPDQRAKRLLLIASHFDDPVWILADHSRYDSRQHSGWLKAEHAYYQEHYPGDSYLRELLAMQIDNRGTTFHGIHYDVRGTRCSGDGNTSTGNTYNNAAIIEEWLQFLPKIEYDLTGDDSAICIERSSIPLIDAEMLNSIGFETTYKIVESIEEVEYCQCNPVNLGNKWTMVRNPLRAITRSTICIDNNIKTPELFRRWIHSVGLCELALNSGVPIMQEFAVWAARQHTKTIITSDHNEYYKEQIAKSKENARAVPITSTARVSFSKSFGITPTKQVEIEKYIRNIKDIGDNVIDQDWRLSSTTLEST